MNGYTEDSIILSEGEGYNVLYFILNINKVEIKDLISR